MTTSILDSLNPEQKKAVITTEGAVLILAGAGSGKTKTVTHRISYLINELKVNPSSILAVTFTNKAAQEMLFRSSKLCNNIIDPANNYPFFRNNQPAFGTFHSICAKILRSEYEKIGFKQNFAIYDSADQIRVIKEILRELNIDEKRYKPQTILHHISNAKNDLISPEEFANIADSPTEEVATEVFPLYQNALKKNNAFDFDDLLVKVVEIFRKDKEVLDYYQRLWKYIHVDEYQDTNHVQYIFIKLLAEKYKNICVVGDPDQSIYGWRGANINNILDFEKDYGQIEVIKLEQNYRSTQNILKAAHHVISKNTNRKEKTLWTENEEGPKIELKQAQDERHEGDLIITGIKKDLIKNSDKTPNDYVILYRTNAQSRSLEEACLRYGLPYRIIGGVKFYERKEIKDILAYLKIILNPDDEISLKRIINIPPRGIGAKTLEKIKIISIKDSVSMYEVIKNIRDYPEFSTKVKNSLHDFQKLIEKYKQEIKNITISDLIENIFTESGLKKYLKDDTLEGDGRIENVNELLSVSQKYDHLDPELSLLYFLQEISLLTDADNDNNEAEKITLMTMHMAKGLEFDTVYIAGAEENIFPHQRSMNDYREMEEERRIAYVCITRAKSNLIITFSKKRMLYGFFQYNEPSRFLYDIPEDVQEGDLNKKQFNEDFILNRDYSQITPYFESNHIDNNQSNSGKPAEPDIQTLTEDDIRELKDGDKVEHASIGTGIIVSKKGSIAEIAFKSGGIKKISLSIAPLRKI